MSLISMIKNIFGVSESDEQTASGTAGSYKNLSGADFKKELEAADNAILLDVRTAGEYAQGKLKGATLLDYLHPNFSKKIETLDKEPIYFLYCRSGNRSAQAGKLMSQKGFNVRNLSGGIGSFPSK